MPEESKKDVVAKGRTEIPRGRIRRYETQDGKMVRFLIGSSILTQTAAANQRQFWRNGGVYVWTIGFTLYVALHHLLDPATSSAPGRGAGSPWINFGMAFLLRLPIFLAPPLILLALINALNRSYFRNNLEQVFARVDLREPSKYYSNSPVQLGGNLAQDRATLQPSLWVLDYDSRQFGAIAIDTDLEGLEELADPNKRTVLIRHLATAPDFRPAGIDYDLLLHARSIVFGPNSNVDRLAIHFCPTLDDHLLTILTQLGFSRLPISVGHSSVTSHHQPFFRNKIILKLLGWSHPSHPWPQETWVFDRQNLQSDQIQ